MFDPLFFIMIMNKLLCQGRMLKCIKQSLDFVPLLTVKAVIKIIGIVKGLLLFKFNKKRISAFL